eukprot:Opistho-1_new@10588
MLNNLAASLVAEDLAGGAPEPLEPAMRPAIPYDTMQYQQPPPPAPYEDPILLDFISRSIAAQLKQQQQQQQQQPLPQQHAPPQYAYMASQLPHPQPPQQAYDGLGGMMFAPQPGAEHMYAFAGPMGGPNAGYAQHQHQKLPQQQQPVDAGGAKKRTFVRASRTVTYGGDLTSAVAAPMSATLEPGARAVDPTQAQLYMDPNFGPYNGNADTWDVTNRMGSLELLEGMGAHPQVGRQTQPRRQ